MVLAVQQIAVGEAFVLAEARPLGASAVRCDHRRHRKLLGGAHQLPCAGTGSDIAANNGFQPGFASALMNKDLGLAMDAIASTGSSARWAPTPLRSTRNTPPNIRTGLQRGPAVPLTPRTAPKVTRVVAEDLDRRHQRAGIRIRHPDVGEHTLVERRRGVLDRRAAQIRGSTSVVRPSVGCGTRDETVGLQSPDRVRDTGDVDLQPIRAFVIGRAPVRLKANSRSNSNRS